jgi:putative N6-adenine-specific DNA methylase
MDFFAPCPRGLEAVLKEELIALGAQIDASPPGGVNFSGDDSLVYKANLWSRIASRVLIKVIEGHYETEDDLYQLALNFDWEEWFGSHKTLRIDTNAIRSPLKSLQFATLRIKDGLCDHFREVGGDRPSIDTHNPDVRIFAFLNDNQATIYVDTSGEPLFKRGWRVAKEDKGAAPLKETLAAGIIALSGWDASSDMPLYDPFCGSGTIVIEAAQKALDMAPGLSRSFGFEQLRGFDKELWTQVRGDALQRFQLRRAARPTLNIAGSDIDPESIEQATINLERAGLTQDSVRLSLVNALEATAPFDQPGILLGNPPYGERIELLEGTFLGLGGLLRQNFGGWNVHLLTSDLRFAGTLGMRERRKTPLFNGALECRLWGFEIFARKPKTDQTA